MEYDNNNSGVLFRNAKKDLDNPEDKKPDYTGQAEIDGTEYWLSGWKRTAKVTGNTFISIKLQDKNDDFDNKQKTTAEVEGKTDEELPF